MQSRMCILISLGLAAGASAAWAGEARTSAQAGSTGGRNGTAAATADYNGAGPGFAQTRTRSGRVSLAQGLAFGFDRTGLSFSSSYAVAPQAGPAVAGTFNVKVGLDGQVATSVGRTVARGAPQRTAWASGGTGRSSRAAPAWASTGGTTQPRGVVRSFTSAKQRRSPLRRWVKPQPRHRSVRLHAGGRRR